MKRKLNSEAGVTLVEMLAAVVVLFMLGLVLLAGLQMAMRTYWTIIAQNEMELLVSTAVDALADDLRYAWNVVDAPGNAAARTAFTYSSDSYGPGTYLDWSTGKITAKSSSGSSESFQFLSTGAYGKDEAYMSYKVCQVDEKTPIVDYAPKDPASGDEITFTIKLKVVLADGSDETISASTPKDGVTIRCLNPKK